LTRDNEIRAFHLDGSRTICRMTDTGREAMREYVETLNTYFNGL